MAVSQETRSRTGMVFALFVLLLVEFLVGMWVNFWVAVPKNHPGVSPDYFAGAAGGVAWALLHGPLMLQIHVALGLIAGLMSLALLVRAVRRRQEAGLLWPIVGACGVFGAAGNGASFLNYGFDFSSFLMSASFAIAIFAYAMWLRGVAA